MTGPFSARSAAPNRTCPTAGCAGPSSARAARPATGPRTARRSAFNTTATRRPTAGKSARPAPDCRPASCLTGSTRTGHRGGNRRTFRPFRPEGIRICLDCKGIDTPRCRTCHDRGGWLMAWLDGDRRTGPIMLYPGKRDRHLRGLVRSLVSQWPLCREPKFLDRSLSRSVLKELVSKTGKSTKRPGCARHTMVNSFLTSKIKPLIYKACNFCPRVDSLGQNRLP